MILLNSLILKHFFILVPEFDLICLQINLSSMSNNNIFLPRPSVLRNIPFYLYLFIIFCTVGWVLSTILSTLQTDFPTKCNYTINICVERFQSFLLLAIFCRIIQNFVFLYSITDRVQATLQSIIKTKDYSTKY